MAANGREPARAGLAIRPHRVPTPACPRDADLAAAEPGSHASGVIRFQANKCTEVGLAADLQEAGVRLLPLDNALEEFETPLHALYQQALAEADNRFLAWHYAALSHGALLWVPPGLEIKEPFFVDFDEDGAAGTMSAPHLAVLLGAGARASVVQSITARAGSAERASSATPSSTCAWPMRRRSRSGNSRSSRRRDLYVRHARAEVGRDASLRHFDAEFGARWAKTRVDCSLDGPGRRGVPGRRVLLRRRASTWTCAPCSGIARRRRPAGPSTRARWPAAGGPSSRG